MTYAEHNAAQKCDSPSAPRGASANMCEGRSPAPKPETISEEAQLSDSQRQRAFNLRREIASIPYKNVSEKRLYFFIKRCFDIVFSAAVLVLFSWLFLLVALIIKCSEPKAPVFFTQTRITKDGKPFKMYKFRTMRIGAEEELASLDHLNEKDGPVFKIKGDPRITKCGRWLRKLSLDEMPQFLNVLLGHMSVVGPRPALPREVATYNNHQRQRLAVRGGLTCYWQTRRNRDSISFDEWVDLDILYIRKCSVWTDVKLIIQTIGVVLTAQGT